MMILFFDCTMWLYFFRQKYKKVLPKKNKYDIFILRK